MQARLALHILNASNSVLLMCWMVFYSWNIIAVPTLAIKLWLWKQRNPIGCPVTLISIYIPYWFSIQLTQLEHSTKSMNNSGCFMYWCDKLVMKNNITHPCFISMKNITFEKIKIKLRVWKALEKRQLSHSLSQHLLTLKEVDDTGWGPSIMKLQVKSFSLSIVRLKLQ